MTQTLIDHARVPIRKEINKADGFIDANAIAVFVRERYPSVDFQSLVNVVIEEIIRMRGSVAWETSGEMKEASSNRMVSYGSHVTLLQSQ